jgi:DsbC/DsbD-like thiol-disulfide interchange protein
LTSAGLKRSDSEVKMAAEASKPDAGGKQTVTLTINVNPGWYIYANPVKNKDFEANQTVVKVLAGKKDLNAVVAYPEGKLKSTGDISYAVYQGKVVIKAAVQRPAGDTEPLTVDVRINTCNEKGICLLPATVKLKVP